jgi:hypothetical protein
MADPVMGNLPLRRVLKCVNTEYQSRNEIHKIWARENPLEVWIELSNTLKRKWIKEKREEKDKTFDEALQDLESNGYVIEKMSKNHPSREHVRLRKETAFYKLTGLGESAKSSAKRSK